MKKFTHSYARRPPMNDLLVLTKVRLNSLVVFTTAGGYYMGAAGPIHPLLMLNACIGTALVASGAAALNQIHERDIDGLMERTRQRPMVQGRMGVGHANIVAYALAAIGTLMLWFGANPLAATLAVVTLLLYILVYTPLKTRTSLATVVGAVPGALPPMIGWAAAHGSVALASWTLFLIMFLWQLPHFLAIATFRRDDYARAGLLVLPVVRGDAVTRRRIIAYLVALLGVTLALVPAGVGGPHRPLPPGRHTVGGRRAVDSRQVGHPARCRLGRPGRAAVRRAEDHPRSLSARAHGLAHGGGPAGDPFEGPRPTRDGVPRPGRSPVDRREDGLA
ncbi:MAG: protoheme IX farnesyltransferase, partial [Acidobacteria bacterium 37-65-4]